MKKKYFITIFVIAAITFIIFSCSTNKVSTKNNDFNNFNAVNKWESFIKLDKTTKISIWEEELNLLLEKLEDRHYDLYHFASYDKLYNKVEEIKSELDKLTDFEIYIKIRELLSLIHDGYTFASLDVKLDYIPINVTKFNDGYYITSVLEKYKEFLGYRLIGINGVSIDEIIERLGKIVSYDNMVSQEYQARLLLNYSDYLKYAIGSDINESFDFVFYNGKTKEAKKVEIKPIKAKDLNNISKNDFVDIFSINNNKKPVYLKKLNKNYWFMFDKYNRILYFQYNSCREDQNYPLREFFNKMFEVIDKEDVKNILIDLRFNGGGNSSLINPFISTLKNNKKFINGTLNIFIAIGDKTFSSAIINSVDLRNDLYGYLIGTPSGGSPNHYGELKSFTLNETGIKIFYPTKYFEMIEGYEGDSLWPDIVVQYNYNDYVKGYDPVFEYIKNSF